MNPLVHIRQKKKFAQEIEVEIASGNIVMNPLVHIRQKKKFAKEIEAEIASGNIRHESTRSHPSEEEIRKRNRSRNCKWKHSL